MTTPFELNLRHVRALRAIVEHGNISAAARFAGLSQPALTQGLAKLEAQFGAVLFERTAHGMRPTSNGKRVLVRTARATTRLARALRSSVRGAGAAQAESRLTSAQVRALLGLAEAGSFV